MAALLILPAAAAPRWVARAAVAASCAASAADAVTTWQGRHVGSEGNPLFRGADGHPVMWRVISFKAVLCAGSIWSEERGQRSRWMVAGHVGTAVLFGWLAKHNEGLINK